MQIDFSSAAPASGAAIALLVEKEGLARLATTLIDATALDLVKAAAQASRFDGEAAAVVETFIADGTGGVRRVLLLGTGAAGEAEYERAGGALTARLLTSGVRTVSVDFGSAGATPKAAARFAAAAA
ncbi:MAG: M17 family peptidase N-terminal domain-containing protein, partial [Pseudomonadota bacterium]